MNRRYFLKTMGTLLLLSGCTTGPDLPSLTFAPTATPSPTPLPPADATLQQYLSAWARADYEMMFNLLTPDSQILVRTADSLAQFYQAPQQTATVTDIETQLSALLHSESQASATFQGRWQTARFGELINEYQVDLRFAEGRWGVVWQPTLILPQLGDGVRMFFIGEQPARGDIYDRNVHALATQGDAVLVGLVPSQLTNREVAIRHVAEITDADPTKMAEDLDTAQPDWFVPVGQIPFETSLAYDPLLTSIPGVVRRTVSQRVYQDGETAAHIVGYMGQISAEQLPGYLTRGYTGDELIGLQGVELWAEPDLAGQVGGRLVAQDQAGQTVAEIGQAPLKQGKSVYLTIDTAFQQVVERLLGPRPGSVVVLDPFDGTIHALASYPRFEPAVLSPGFDVSAWLARYTTEDKPLVNRATQGLYPPASIFKIVTLTAALESLALPPETSYLCPGLWTGLGEQFAKKCWLETGHGTINLLDGLTQSCDTVFYELGLALHRHDPELLPRWSRLFGLGKPTGINGVSEFYGVVPDRVWAEQTLGQPYFDGDAVNSAIGQGYTLSTPLQVARLMAAVANGGQLIQPRLIDKIVDVNGEPQPLPTEPPQNLPIQPKNLALIRDSLTAVVNDARGTARRGLLAFPYPVAGKTGTAESGQEIPHSWFAGYTPIEKPAVVICVVLEYAGEGSAEAVPLFRQVAEAFYAWRNANP